MDQRGQRARYVTARLEKSLGALPVVADYCRRLDLAGIIDRACPVRDLAHLSHGQVIEALIAKCPDCDVTAAKIKRRLGNAALEHADEAIELAIQRGLIEVMPARQSLGYRLAES